MRARVQAASVPREQVCRCFCRERQNGSEGERRHVPLFPPHALQLRPSICKLDRFLTKQLTVSLRTDCPPIAAAVPAQIMAKAAPRKVQRSAPPTQEAKETHAKMNPARAGAKAGATVHKWLPVACALLLAISLLLAYNYLFAGAFSGQFYITVEKIDEFSDTAGFMDTTDPFVEITVGNQTLRTSDQNNAGGSNVSFGETLQFNKQLLDKSMKVRVFDKNVISDTLLGELDVNLNSQKLIDDAASADSIPFELHAGGKGASPAGKVMLVFSRFAPLLQATPDAQDAAIKPQNSTDGIDADHNTSGLEIAMKYFNGEETHAKDLPHADEVAEVSNLDSQESLAEEATERANVSLTAELPASSSYLGLVSAGASVLLLVGVGVVVAKRSKMAGPDKALTATANGTIGQGRIETANGSPSDANPAKVKKGMISSLFNRDDGVQSAAATANGGAGKPQKKMQEEIVSESAETDEAKVEQGLLKSLFRPKAQRSAPPPPAIKPTNDSAESKPAKKSLFGALTYSSSPPKTEKSNDGKLHTPVKKSWFGATMASPEKMKKANGTEKHKKPEGSLFGGVFSSFSKEKPAAQLDAEIEKIEDLKGLIGYLFSPPPETPAPPRRGVFARAAMRPHAQRSSAPPAASRSLTGAKTTEAEDVVKSVSGNKQWQILLSIGLFVILAVFLATSMGSLYKHVLANATEPAAMHDSARGMNESATSSNSSYFETFGSLIAKVSATVSNATTGGMANATGGEAGNASNSSYFDSLSAFVSSVTSKGSNATTVMNESETSSNSSYFETFGSLIAKVSATVSNATTGGMGFPFLTDSLPKAPTAIFFNVEAFRRMDPGAMVSAASQMSHETTFREMDTDVSGNLVKEELRDFLRKEDDYNDEVALDKLFSAMDSDRDGFVCSREAKAHQQRELEMIMEWLQSQRKAPIGECKHLFQKMDMDGSGGLCVDELRKVVRDQGDYIDEAALLKLFDAMDLNHDGKITFSEAVEFEEAGTSLTSLPAQWTKSVAAALSTMFVSTNSTETTSPSRE